MPCLFHCHFLYSMHVSFNSSANAMYTVDSAADHQQQMYRPQYVAAQAAPPQQRYMVNPTQCFS